MTKTGYFLDISSRHLPLCKKLIMHSSACTSLASAAFSLVTIKLDLILERVSVNVELENQRIGSQQLMCVRDMCELILIFRRSLSYGFWMGVLFARQSYKVNTFSNTSSYGTPFFQNAPNLMQIGNKSSSRF